MSKFPKIGGLKTYLMCSNPECSPNAALGVGQKLVRYYYNEPDAARCPICKHNYDTIILGSNTCPICGRPMLPVKCWSLKCPKCGRMY